jgi:hypothetical protein
MGYLAAWFVTKVLKTTHMYGAEELERFEKKFGTSVELRVIQLEAPPRCREKSRGCVLVSGLFQMEGVKYRFTDSWTAPRKIVVCSDGQD